MHLLKTSKIYLKSFKSPILNKFLKPKSLTKFPAFNFSNQISSKLLDRVNLSSSKKLKNFK